MREVLRIPPTCAAADGGVNMPPSPPAGWLPPNVGAAGVWPNSDGLLKAAPNSEGEDVWPKREGDEVAVKAGEGESVKGLEAPTPPRKGEEVGVAAAAGMETNVKSYKLSVRSF